MMGGHHAISGAAAWLAVAGSAQVAGYPVGMDALGLDGLEVLSGAVVAAGAALLPDIDHPSGTAARSAGPMSRALSSAVGRAVGHRGATHTLLAVAAFTALAMLAVTLDQRMTVPVLGEVQMGAVLVVTVMCALGTRALTMVRGLVAPWLVGALCGVVVAAFAPDTSIWLPVAVALGALVHLLGDLLTADGIPFPTWPLVIRPPRRLSGWWKADGDISLPLLGTVGSGREWALCSVLSTYATIGVCATALQAVPSATALG